MTEVIAADEEFNAQSYPTNVTGMLIGAFTAGLGLFLIGSPTSGLVTIIVGFIVYLIGIIIFAL